MGSVRASQELFLRFAIANLWELDEADRARTLSPLTGRHQCLQLIHSPNRTSHSPEMNFIPLVQNAIAERRLPPECEALLAGEIERRNINETERAAFSLLEALIANGTIELG